MPTWIKQYNDTQTSELNSVDTHHSHLGHEVCQNPVKYQREAELFGSWTTSCVNELRQCDRVVQRN